MEAVCRPVLLKGEKGIFAHKLRENLLQPQDQQQEAQQTEAPMPNTL